MNWYAALSAATCGSEYYHALDKTDIFALNPSNLPGENLWNPDDPDSYRDLRLPSFGPESIDPDIKPMRQTTMVVGTEYQMNPTTVFGVNWIHSQA